jgi:two-component system response regulator GlrR
MAPAFQTPSNDSTGEQPAVVAPAPAAAGAARAGLPQLSLTEARMAFEKDYLVLLLRRHRGNATSAAKEAGKHRSELYALLKKHGITPGEFRDEPVS